MKNTISGKVVAITGGARGIGYATAKHLIAQGAKVAIGDIDKVVLDQSAEALGTSAHQYLDVTSAESFEAFLDHVEETVGPIDVLVNNAGIMPVGRIEEEPDAVTRRILDINVYGVILGSKLAVQRMLPRKSGHIINIASMAGEVYTPGLATYCASKFAVLGFTDSARVEHRSTGIRFSAVLPSFVNTELTAGTRGAAGLRNAEPEEIAQAIGALIERPRPRVRVTRIAGMLASSQKYMPRAAAEGVARLFGMDTVMLEVDTSARKAYEDRARNS
jgi:NAD(P)-dependent dehydrogenase (short-subunit alcohol dehydrogenase family)